MRRIIFFSAMVTISCIFSRCNKAQDYYYAEYLNQAELARPGKVESLEIQPGYYRAKVRFKIGPDRRINRVKISYKTSIRPLVNTLSFDITDRDYGNYREIEITDLPEASLSVYATTFDRNGDSSNVVEENGILLFGNRYTSLLANRVFLDITTLKDINGKDVKRLNFLSENGKPQDPALFYPLQKTIVTYPLASGGTKTMELSLYDNYLLVPDIAASGIITHYSTYKPVKNAIDIFNSNTISVTF